MKWDHADGISAEIIDFAAAKKRLGTRPKNKFAVELDDVARDIRLGVFDPDALFIAFRAPHPEDPTVTQYPVAAIDMDAHMVSAMIKFLYKELKRR
jgi:hypothetical protein